MLNTMSYYECAKLIDSPFYTILLTLRYNTIPFQELSGAAHLLSGIEQAEGDIDLSRRRVFALRQVRKILFPNLREYGIVWYCIVWFSFIAKRP